MLQFIVSFFFQEIFLFAFQLFCYFFLGLQISFKNFFAGKNCIFKLEAKKKKNLCVFSSAFFSKHTNQNWWCYLYLFFVLYVGTANRKFENKIMKKNSEKNKHLKKNNKFSAFYHIFFANKILFIFSSFFYNQNEKASMHETTFGSELLLIGIIVFQMFNLFYFYCSWKRKKKKTVKKKILATAAVN